VGWREEDAGPAKVDTGVDGINPGDAFDRYICGGNAQLYELV